MTESGRDVSLHPPGELPPAHWQILESFPVSPTIHLTLYRSMKTGLRVALATVPGPLVMGYFTLATESHSNDGCPHTLEHLIFMGSSSFPYKGILDLIANRNLSQGTNAWTDVDHTCYTLETAGEQGFCTLLPIYLDHILYPIITDAAFLTEVHHITGEGTNAGVVYAEMQARENTDGDMMSRAIHSALYPGDCGYAAETGGLMKDIRELSVNTIRDYHRDYYRPENLCITVIGMASISQLFNTALASTEASILQRSASLPPYIRPWSSPVPAFTTTVHQTLPYPSEDEEHGSVYIGWRACEWSDFYSRTAIDMMWSYLSDTTISPLHQGMIEIEEPYAGDIDTVLLEKKVGVHMIEFEAVPVEKLAQVKDAFFAIIREIVSKELIDMPRLAAVIRKEIRQTTLMLEEHPHQSLAGYVISNFLYANDHHTTSQHHQLQEELGVLERLFSLLKEPVSFWVMLMRTWILEPPYALIIGQPSAAESERLMTEEKERVKQQIAALTTKDADALSHLASKLQQAIDINSLPPPSHVLARFQTPDLTKVPEHIIYTARPGDAEDVLLQAHNAKHDQAAQLNTLLSSQPPLSSLPLFVQLDHIISSFVQFKLFVDTSHFSPRLKSYLPLYRDMLFESPLLNPADGSIQSSADVVQALENELVHYESTQGLSSSRFTAGAFSSYVIIMVKTEAEDYQKGLTWLYRLLHHLQFDRDRLAISIKKMLASIPELKNDGSHVVKAASAEINFNQGSIHHAVNFIRQQTLLKQWQKLLVTEEGYQSIVQELKEIQSLLVQETAMRLHIAGNLIKQGEHLIPSIQQCFTPHATTNALAANGHNAAAPHAASDVVYTSSYRIPFTAAQAPIRNYLLSVKACETSYLMCSIPLPAAFTYTHPDIAALRLCIEYLTTLEGPLWRRIRGLGFSYSYSIRLDIESGLILFVLFKSTNLPGAYTESRRILSDYNTAHHWEASELMSARSSLGFEILASGDTMIAAAERSFLNYMKQQPADHQHRLLGQLEQVDGEELQQALQRYLLPLFDRRESHVAIATNPANVEAIVSVMGGGGVEEGSEGSGGGGESGGGRYMVVVKDMKAWFEGGSEGERGEAKRNEEKGEGENDDDDEEEEEEDGEDEEDEDDEEDDDDSDGEEDDEDGDGNMR